MTSMDEANERRKARDEAMPDVKAILAAIGPARRDIVRSHNHSVRHRAHR